MDFEKRKKLNISMLELICTLCILAFLSVFLVKLFLGANSLKTKARDINKACLVAESMGDIVKGSETMEEAVEKLKLERIQNNYSTSIYEKYYDSQWRQVKKPDRYRVVIMVEQQQVGEKELYDIEIKVKYEKKYPVIRQEEGQELVSLHVASYK